MMRQTDIKLTHSLTAALDQLRVVASFTSNDPGPRSRQHQQIGQRLLPLAAANFSIKQCNIMDNDSICSCESAGMTDVDGIATRL